MKNPFGYYKLIVAVSRQVARMLALLGLRAATRLDVSRVPAQSSETYDIVLQGGRLMDPETGLDAIRDVRIRGDRIVEISGERLQGHEVINVAGLVVAPGFIDLLAHGQTNQANEFQAHDGVTTALELESGRPFPEQWLASRMGNALLNFGASVDHSAIRWMAMEKYELQASEVKRIIGEEVLDSKKRLKRLKPLFREAFGARYESLNSKETASMLKGLSTALEAGGIGIGVPVGYYPGATREEIFNVYAFAAEKQTVIFSHVRDFGIASIQEAIEDASVNGTSLHIHHINSTSLSHIGVALSMVEAAQKRGLDITAELYPYTAASSSLQSTLFDEGWQQRMGINYGDLQWVATGEHLTEETFKKYRDKRGRVIIQMMKPEWIEMGIRAPFTMIASDGLQYNPGAHPRSAGTFSRVLGRYVRVKQMLSLMDALRKMTIMPAKRLEDIAPAARLKGRLQVGCDADITIFDPDTIIDTATFEKDLSFSEGIHYVIVNGTFVVKNTKTVSGVYPGRPILGKYRR